jgi:hypothetical protein
MRVLLSNYYYFIIITIINNSLLVLCQLKDPKMYIELIKEPVSLTPIDNRIINHADLPIVNEEVSVTLKLNILIHEFGWSTIFHKGILI